MESIRIEDYQTTSEELVQITWVTTWRKVALLYGTYAVVSALALGSILKSIPLQIGVGLALLGLMLVAYRYRKLPSLCQSPSFRNILRKRTLEVRDDGVEVWGEEGLHGFTPWSFITATSLLPNHFLIYITNAQFFPIRKSWLSEGELQRLIQLTHSKIQSGANS